MQQTNDRCKIMMLMQIFTDSQPTRHFNRLKLFRTSQLTFIYAVKSFDTE